MRIVRSIGLVLIVMTMLLSVSSPGRAYAQTPEEIQAMSLLGNWPQYVPGDGPLGLCPAGGTGAGGGGGVGGDPSVEGDNVRIAYEYFVAKNLAPFRSAAIVGNLYVESGVDPNINQTGGGPGRGIAQWSVGQRWAELQQFAQQRGGNERDLQVQLEFIWYEMTTVPPWNQTLPAIQAATTMNGPGGATFEFMDKFEKPGIPHLDARESAATSILQLYGNGAPDSGPPGEGAAPAPGGAVGAAGTGANCNQANGGGSFTGAPGQTKQQGKGFSLNENTDYTGTPCAPGSTETEIYRHSQENFQIRLCRIGTTGIIVASIVSDRVVAMLNAAAQQGITLNGSAFRSYERQLEIYTERGCPCDPPVARPGNSMHERGLAIDFTGSNGGTLRAGTPAFNWLSQNAASYGFYNLPSESWHWSTSGG